MAGPRHAVSAALLLAAVCTSASGSADAGRFGGQLKELEQEKWDIDLLAIAGITTTTSPPWPPDCGAGVLDWERSWDERKKEWCCEKHGFGCLDTVAEMPSTTTAAAYDCEADYYSTRWSSRRREWCCFHKGRGCPTTTSQAPRVFECRVAGAWAWTAGEQVWCCQHKGLSCPDPVEASSSTTSAEAPKSVRLGAPSPAAPSAAAPRTTAAPGPRAPEVYGKDILDKRFTDLPQRKDQSSTPQPERLCWLALAGSALAVTAAAAQVLRRRRWSRRGTVGSAPAGVEALLPPGSPPTGPSKTPEATLLLRELVRREEDEEESAPPTILFR